MKTGLQLGAHAPILFLAGLFLTACASQQEPRPGIAPEDPQALITNGAEVFGYSCGRCHNPRAAAERTDREWETVVDHMRVRANLTGREARAVTAFMRALNAAPVERVVYDTVVVMDTLVRIDTVFVVQRAAAVAPKTADTARAVKPPPPVPVPPEPDAASLTRRGRELVVAKGCSGCHVMAGKGGTVGPKLDGIVSRRGEDFVRRKLLNPRFNSPNTVMPSFGLSESELDAMVAYLRSLSG